MVVSLPCWLCGKLVDRNKLIPVCDGIKVCCQKHKEFLLLNGTNPDNWGLTSEEVQL